MEVLSFLPSFTTFLYLVNLVVILGIIYYGKDSSTTFAWIFLILLIPVFGLLAYLIFGLFGPKKSNRIIAEEKLFQNHLRGLMDDHHADQSRERTLFKKRGFYKKYRNVLNLASKNAEALLSSSNRVQVFYNGKEMFDKMYDDLKDAKSFIHMAYFIWRDDELTKKFVDLLVVKATQGVEVRIFLDYVGSLFLSKKYIKRLKEKGIKVHFFSAMYSPIQLHTINYRNHMKVVVIDGKISYSGGMNMGKEYVDGGKFHYWRDTHLRVEGEASTIYNAVFLAFWHRISKERFPDKKYFPKHKQVKGSTLQVVGSGIDVNWSSMENILLNLIVNARKTVYIQSPYFVPSDSFLTALKIAALSGVKVSLMVTGVPDKKIPYWSAFNYFHDLLRAGVRIYHYNRGFLHSKVIVIDKEVSVVGSTNIDIRSFKLNYEIGTILYDFRLSREIALQFSKDLRYCKRFTLEDYMAINPLAKFRNSFFRLFAPIL